MATKKRGLGRGLDALLGSGNQGAREEPDNESDGLRTVPVEFLKPGRYQPRTGMDPERLAELADSIRAQGLIQPIVVRPQGKDRSEEHTSELQSLMRISYAVFCLKKKKHNYNR